MARKPKAVRGKFSDEKYLGAEPVLKGEVSNAQVILAYNWYNYFYDAAQAKAWVVEYFKKNYKNDKELIKHVNRIDDRNLITAGWNCRILLVEGSLPDKLKQRMEESVRRLAEACRGIESGSGEAEAGTSKREGASGNTEGEANKEVPVKVVISIQERITNRANDLIADVEGYLDNYYRDGTTFKPVDWLSQQDVKPAIAQRIADYYKPLYSEVFDALQGKDAQLKEAYSSWTKPKLKAYVEFVKSIISAAETRATLVKTRKPRKKKEKPASAIVSKLKYKETDTTYKITSVDPKQLLGANQVWLFNTKYRTMTVYNAMGPAGIGVKGSTLLGWDEKTSIVKKLRKPDEQIKKLLEGGKVILRKYMDDIKCKPKIANGRINKDVVILRIIK